MTEERLKRIREGLTQEDYRADFAATKIVAAYEEAKGLAPYTVWYGDYDLYEVKHGISAGQFKERLENALEAVDMTLEEWRSGDLIKQYTETAAGVIRKRACRMDTGHKRMKRRIL